MPERSPITIALVNDFEVVLAGLAGMLEGYADRVTVVETVTGSALTRTVDVALYDTFGQPLGEGIDQGVVRDAAAMASRLVVYSWNGDPVLVDAALAGGADGYVLKQAGAADLVAALERVSAGEQVRPAADRPDAGIDVDVEVDWPGRAEGLTARESEVVALLVQGLSNSQVAARAFLSVSTVKSYLRSAYRTMGVESRSQAVVWAIDRDFRRDQSRTRPPRGADPRGS